MLNMENNTDLSGNEKPPLFKNWNWWYLIVLTNLIVLILLFYFISKIFH